MSYILANSSSFLAILCLNLILVNSLTLMGIERGDKLGRDKFSTFFDNVYNFRQLCPVVEG